MDTTFETSKPDPSPPSRGTPAIRLVGGISSMLAGSLVLLGGIILHFGEESGRLVIFPFAGRLMILVGIAILAIGAAFAGRRPGMTLGILMVLGGIGLYAFGLAYVEQLGTRRYQLAGLLTTLVGLVVAYAIFGMNGATAPVRGPKDPPTPIFRRDRSPRYRVSCRSAVFCPVATASLVRDYRWGKAEIRRRQRLDAT